MADEYTFQRLAQGMDNGETARGGLRVLADNPEVSAFVAVVYVGGQVRVVFMADNQPAAVALLAVASEATAGIRDRMAAERLAEAPPMGSA